MEGNVVAAVPRQKGTRELCERMMQEIAVTRDKVCQDPKCSDAATVGHHIFRRNKLSTAFEPDNLVGLCVVHHGRAHSNPAFFKKQMIDRLGEKRYYELRRQSNETAKNIDYDETYQFLWKVLHAWKHAG